MNSDEAEPARRAHVITGRLPPSSLTLHDRCAGLVLREENLYFARALLPLDRISYDVPEKRGTVAEHQSFVLSS